MLRLTILIVLVSLAACKRHEKIKLEKIIFHTSRCFGSCPEYHAQINSNKTILLYSEYVSSASGGVINLNDPDTSKMGYFTGEVSDRQYSDLESELENIGLGDLQFDETLTCCDASLITIVVYYNGKRKFLKSMFPPREANRLISLLRNIIETTKLSVQLKNLTLKTILKGSYQVSALIYPFTLWGRYSLRLRSG